eukprot:3430053-Prymnesium_polylepis.2
MLPIAPIASIAPIAPIAPIALIALTALTALIAWQGFERLLPLYSTPMAGYAISDDEGAALYVQ